MDEKSFSKGYQIFKEGDPPNDGVYLIKEGSVEITKKQGGEHISLAVLHQNAIFGEMALLDSAPRSATATALTNTRCYVLSPKEFENRLKMNDIDAFMRGVFRVVVHTARDMTQKYASTQQSKDKK